MWKGMGTLSVEMNGNLERGNKWNIESGKEC